MILSHVPHHWYNKHMKKLTLACSSLCVLSVGWRTAYPHISQMSPWIYSHSDSYGHTPLAKYGHSNCPSETCSSSKGGGRSCSSSLAALAYEAGTRIKK